VETAVDIQLAAKQLALAGPCDLRTARKFLTGHRVSANTYIRLAREAQRLGLTVAQSAA